MKLYGYYRSSASYRIRIVLNVKGIEWEYISVRLDKGEQLDTEHSKRNPMKLVPVLDTGVECLAQSVAIAEYLEETHPSPPLMPTDPIQKAQLREMVQIIASDIQPIANLRVLKYVQPHFAADQWSKDWIGRGFEAFEARASQRSTNGQFSFGDSLSLADVFLMPQVYNAERFGLDMTPFPTIRSIVEHCSTIDAVASAHPSLQPDAPSE
jgi:maleylpyruvate isomerase